MMHRLGRIVLLLITLVTCDVTLSNPRAEAVPLAPGVAVPLDGTSLAERPELASVVIADVLRPFAIDLGDGLLITGVVHDQVVREDVAGTLDFYWRIFNDPDSDGPIIGANRRSFTGFSTDVDFRVDGVGTEAPDAAPRTGDGSEVRFGFWEDSIGPGEESLFFFIKTNATAFNDEGLGTIAGFRTVEPAGPVATTIPAFQPVPEPATLVLLGGGFAGLGAVAWRRERRRSSPHPSGVAHGPWECARRSNAPLVPAFRAKPVNTGICASGRSRARENRKVSR